MEILDIMKNLQTDEEIEKFITYRLSMLENDEHKTIGINTDTSVYTKLLNENIKINLIGRIIIINNRVNASKFGSLMFDDNNIYKYLIKASKKYDNVYEAVYNAIKAYGTSKLSNSKIRDLIYRCFSSTTDKALSIKVLHYIKQTFCTERSGIAHNMFKFLGIESDYVVIGLYNNHFHSFNIVYPEGREKDSLLYDATCTLGNLPKMYCLEETAKNDLLSNKSVTLTNYNTMETIKKMTNQEIYLEDDNTKYTIFKDGQLKTLVDYVYPERAKKLIYKNRY